MYIYIVNNKPFKSYKAADRYAVELRNNGESVSCRVECGNTSTRHYSQKMRVKNSRNTYNKMEYAGTGYGCELWVNSVRKVRYELNNELFNEKKE